MRFKIIIPFLFLIISTQLIYSQVRTEEKKKTVTEQKGDTTVTSSVILSTSEDITPRRHMIVINPLKFLLFYNISYYQAVSDNIGIGAGLQSPTIGPINGFGLNAEVRFYPSQKSLRGFYIAPNFSYNRLYHDNRDNALYATSIGGLIGWQWFPGADFAMGLGIGIDHYMASTKESDFGDYDGNAPALRFDIGYGW
ncbi:MAG: hypothetical protein HY964_00475 [Ignavibacteriales bacterium]|nr:hypothetical protein [Ignavibacteriales bacterium]